MLIMTQTLAHSARPLVVCVSRAALLLALLSPTLALADHCGEADCGEHGTCREESLIAKCDCDPGYVSVLTFFGTSSQGAFCAPLPAAPGEAGS